ncbi:SDR family NAD(P)-dependent oxidoreductase [Tepidicaulis sp.]|uniref:SDR family NAD(P)-dependent oxidoreductase n=1 Tax=Tepidicaulis sp. TaxID=1920809 RepID=UPI003B5BDB95
MDLGLKGKRAVVLGGTRGIGRAIADTLADEGCNVAICARNQDQIDAAVSELGARGVKASGASVDIADGAALKAFIEKAAGELGGIDILVSNASALSAGNSEENWQAGFNVDVMGAQRSMEAARSHLEKSAAANGDAAFVIISSVSAAETSSPNAYGAMKAALIHMAKGFAKAGAEKHVRTNVVSPGTVYFEGGVWDMAKKHAPDRFNAALEKNPMGRMASPQDIANAAVFLASPASSFTSGINMVVDGAYTSRVNF